jgi:hypothetical protein
MGEQRAASAYHCYPLCAYEAESIRNPEATIDTILRSQKSRRGFNPENMPLGVCKDIDAIGSLIRAATKSGYKKELRKLPLRRAMARILSCRNDGDGCESIPECGWSFGDHPLTTSEPGEPNLLAAWFRTLCLAVAGKIPRTVTSAFPMRR